LSKRLKSSIRIKRNLKLAKLEFKSKPINPSQKAPQAELLLRQNKEKKPKKPNNSNNTSLPKK